MNPYAVVDLETTGLNPRSDGIIQIAIRRSDGVVWDQWINPERTVTDGILELTGSLGMDFSQYPRMDEVREEVARLLHGFRVVGHNVDFDVEFLTHRGINIHDSLDTLAWGRLAFANRSQWALSDWFPDVEEHWHDARVDAKWTEELLHRIRAQLEEFSSALQNDLERFLGEEWRWWNISTSRSHTPSALYRPEADRFKAQPLERQLVEASGEAWLQSLDPSLEVRLGQQDMVRAVDAALEERQVLLVEAGTGTGKSLAYLSPTILRSLSQGERVVIATHTVALQEQLWLKDMPLARKNLPLRTALVKGRGRYICLLKASEVVQESAVIGESRERRWSLAQLLTYLETTDSGDLEAFPVKSEIGRALWSEIMADSHSCAGSQCPYAGPCFMRRARHEAESAHLVIVNHALLAAHVAQGGILPEFSHLVVDEAHHLLEVMEQTLGFDLNLVDWRRRYRDSMHPRHGLFGRLPMHPELRGQVEMIRDRYRLLDESFTRLRDTAVAHTPPSSYDRRAVRLTPELVDELSERLLAPWREVRNILGELADLGDALWQEADSRGNGDHPAWLRFHQWQQEIAEQAMGMDLWGQVASDRVSWWEMWTGSDGEAYVRWRWSPVEIQEILRDKLWDEVQDAVLTSATLSIKGQFHYVAQQLGIPQSRMMARQVTSPFDWSRQARLIMPSDSPSPDDAHYLAALADVIHKVALSRQGHVLVLLTSYRAVQEVSWRIRQALSTSSIRTLAQNIDGPARRLVGEFRHNPKSVLIGTATYWEGVDIPGDDLQVVIVGRLPFRAPGDPLEEAKLERIRQRGKSPFYYRSLPEAVLRFQQGFGRLIRTSSDRGVVIVFDPRVHPGRSRYGRIFLDALPPVPREMTTTDRIVESIEAFWGAQHAHSYE